MLPHFYYHPRMLAYNFGPQHPLKPERLRRTVDLLSRYGVDSIDPGPGSVSDALRVHDDEYVEVVRRLGAGESLPKGSDPELEPFLHGFGSYDNPPFPGMFEASLAYLAGTVRAAEAVRHGAQLAFGLAGGLHHAQRSRASGFCIFDDPAVACHILLERFDRVAYFYIHVHHGDGVQWIFYSDPRVLTCSIHEDPHTLYPGTGFVEETGADFSSLNVPLQAKSSGDVWLWAFENGILPALERFQPQAIVLQMGTDTHFLDPLGHLRCTAQEWLKAVEHIRNLGLPIVAVGGGGYNLTTVSRMWAAACLALGRVEFGDQVPPDLGSEWEMPTYFDAELPQPREIGRQFAEGVVDWLHTNHLPNISKA